MTEPKSVEVVVNGAKRDVPCGTTIGQLLEQLGVPVKGTAVELEGEIVAPKRLADTVLQQGQRLEIVRLVGGG